MRAVDCVVGWVEFLECGGDARAPGAFAVAGVEEEGVGWGAEEVAYGFVEGDLRGVGWLCGFSGLGDFAVTGFIQGGFWFLVVTVSARVDCIVLSLI